MTCFKGCLMMGGASGHNHEDIFSEKEYLQTSVTG